MVADAHHLLSVAALGDERLRLAASLLLGTGLSASCGFRVFLPPLVLSAAALYFVLPLPEAISWLGSFPAFFLLLTAALIEVGAYYVPWLDHALDTLAAPAAVIAGTLVTSAFLSGQMDPPLQWSLALIAGGGAAGTIQGLTTTGRLSSFALTGGLGNPLIATAENFLAIAVPVFAILFPALAVLFGGLVLLLALYIGSRLGRLFFRSRQRQNNDTQPRSD